MSPIYTSFIPDFKFEPTGIRETDKKAYCDLLHAMKLLASHTKVAVDALRKNNFSAFDPIVHDNACQIRASRVITLAHDEALRKEADALKEEARRVEQAIPKYLNKFALPSQPASFGELSDGLGFSLSASPELTYLLQSHFLTLTKTFQMRPDGSEIARIDCNDLRNRLSKQIHLETVNEIVEFTQIKLAEASIRYIQEEASHLDPFTQRQLARIEQGGKRPCSNTFYNFKTILTRGQFPFLFRNYGNENPVGLFYSRQEDSFIQVDPKGLRPEDPVFVVEGFLPKQTTLQKELEGSLLDIALCNAARVSQCNEEMEPQAIEEIQKYRQMAQNRGCNLENPRTFSIVHTRAGKIGDELLRLQ